MSKNRKKAILHILLISLLIIFISTGGFALWFSQHYKAIIRKNLPEWIAKATDSVYHISFDDVNINIFTRSVTLTGIKFWPDSLQLELRKQNKRRVFTTTVNRIQKLVASGIDWTKLASKELYCRNITLYQPQSNILSDFSQKGLEERIPNKKNKGAIERMFVEQVEIIDPDVSFHYIGKNNTYYCYMKKGKVILNNWAMDIDNTKDTSSFLYAKNGSIQFESFIYREDSSLYQVKSTSLDFSSTGKSVKLKDVTIAPLMRRDEFYQKIGHQKEIYNLHFPEIEIVDFNWKKLISDVQLHASVVNVTDPSIDIFFSTIPTPDTGSRVGNFPQQLLQKWGWNVSFNSINIKNAHIKYSELSQETRKTGIVVFDGVHGSLTNVTNIDSLMNINKHCLIKLSGKCMQTSPIDVSFDLLLPDKHGYFTMDGSMKDLDAKQIAAPSLALAMADIKSFHLQEMKMHVEGNQNYSKGVFVFRYTDLSMELEKMNENSKISAMPILSWATNKLFVFPNNPMPGKDVRTETTYLERDKQKSFFILIWKNIYLGAQESAVRNKRLLEILRKSTLGIHLR